MAKTCPIRFATHWISTDASSSDVYHDCTGSNCMFWRVAAYDVEQGYCGLAGKPEIGTEALGGLVPDPAEEVGNG